MNENLKEAAGMGAWHVGTDRGRRVVITVPATTVHHCDPLLSVAFAAGSIGDRSPMLSLQTGLDIYMYPCIFVVQYVKRGGHKRIYVQGTS